MIYCFQILHSISTCAATPWALTSVLYRLKKYQYIFYKHFLLHGLNVSAAVTGGGAGSGAWQIVLATSSNAS